MKHWCASIQVLLLLLLCQAAASAQSNTDGGAWFATFSRGEIGNDDSALRWWFDGHLRFVDDADGFTQSIVRPGVGYAIDDNVTAWAGYGWIRNVPETVSAFDEHRLWQQLTWSHTCDWMTTGYRSRLEQRLLEPGDDTGLRFRQLVSWRQPIDCESRYTFVLWDELFLHLNDTDWGARSGFDQNRAFVGFGVKRDADSPCRVEIGYLNQRINRRGPDNLTNHLLSVNMFYNP